CLPPALLPVAGAAALPRGGAGAPRGRRAASLALPLRGGAGGLRSDAHARAGGRGRRVITKEEPAVAMPVGERAKRGEEILRIDGLVKHFPIRAGLLKRQVGQIHAVDGVDLALAAGETLG